MDLSKLHNKLIAAARATPPDEGVPYAFEKRIMAHLAGCKALDPWHLWGRAMSRSAACCVAVVFLVSIISYALPSSTATNQVSLSQDVEQTLLASVDNLNAEPENQ